MNFNPQYKVIGPYNYDRIIHNIEKIYAKRQDILWRTQSVWPLDGGYVKKAMIRIYIVADHKQV